MKEGQKHILIIRFSALGDVAMTIPVVYSAARQYPDVQFTFATRPFFSRLFINPPSNLSVFVADTQGEYNGWLGLLRLIKTLNRLRVTHVADLHNVLRSWVVSTAFRLKGQRVAMVSKGRIARQCLLSHRLAFTMSYILRYQKVFSRLGCPAEMTFKSLFEAKTIEPPIRVEENAIGVAPFARYENKTYPLDNMKKVVRCLAQHGFTIYLFGGGEREKTILEGWASDKDHCISLVGKYSIEKELSIMSRLRVLISMDSANQHLASLVGTRVVSLWGSTTPACGFAPYAQTAEDSLCMKFPCQPCTIAGSNKCKTHTYMCLHQLSPELIVEHVMKILSQNP